MILEVLKHTLTITSFVLAMMLLIEYITVRSRGNWNRIFQQKPWLQIVLAALLGVLPGCLGVFVVVSLYAHRIVGFAALVTAMIATSGDEAFVLFATIPEDAVILTLIIFFVAIVCGFIISLFMKHKSLMVLRRNYLKFHTNEPECVCFERRQFIKQWKNLSFQRGLLVTMLLIILLFFITGEIGPKKWNWIKITFIGVLSFGLLIVSTVSDHFLNDHLWKHTIKKHLTKIFLWTFGTFLVIHLLHLHRIQKANNENVRIIHKQQFIQWCDSLQIDFEDIKNSTISHHKDHHADKQTANTHNHLKNQIITHDYSSRLLFGENTLLLDMHELKKYFDNTKKHLGKKQIAELENMEVGVARLKNRSQKIHIIILVFALLLGIIPESGPHIIFIFLYAQGIVPFSILLANSIVQDGHGAVPLLAESKRSFFAMKTVNLIVGLIAGLAGFWLDW